MIRKKLFRAGLLLFTMIVPLHAQAPVAPTKTSDVLVMLTVKPGIPREQIMTVLPDEVRATVRLYLDGKIRQWYSRGDGKGVVFILDCKDVAEARALMEQLPLAKGKLADLEYTPMAPLAPLGILLRDPPVHQ
jgi:hypothetical protein